MPLGVGAAWKPRASEVLKSTDSARNCLIRARAIEAPNFNPKNDRMLAEFADLVGIGTKMQTLQLEGV